MLHPLSLSLSPLFVLPLFLPGDFTAHEQHSWRFEGFGSLLRTLQVVCYRGSTAETEPSFVRHRCLNQNGCFYWQVIRFFLQVLISDSTTANWHQNTFRFWSKESRKLSDSRVRPITSRLCSHLFHWWRKTIDFLQKIYYWRTGISQKLQTSVSRKKRFPNSRIKNKNLFNIQ